MRDLAHQAAGRPADSISRLLPDALWRIRTRGGEPLDGIHVLAWRWLADRADRHGRVEFLAVDLAARFGRRSHASALAWIGALEGADVVYEVESQRGTYGSTRLRMRSVDEVARRAGLAAIEADPQQHFSFAFAGEEPDQPPAVVEFAGPAKCWDAAQHPNITAHVAASRPDVMPALWEALGVQLGWRNVELYLGLSAFELAAQGCEGADAPHRIYLPSQALRDHVATAHGRSIRRAFADASLPGEVELCFDRAKCWDAAQHPNITAQQPTLVGSSSRASNQPTNQGDFFETARGRPPAGGRMVTSEAAAGTPAQEPGLPPLLARAAELYARIGDESLWKWVAIAAVLLVDDGQLSTAEVERLIRDHGDDFGRAIKELAQQRGCWPTQGRLKSRLRAAGIKWKRSWERGTRPNQPR